MSEYLALRRNPSTLVIVCSQLSYEGWATQELGLGPLDVKLISVAGGPAALAHGDLVATDYTRMCECVSFLLAEFPSIHTVIGINHGNNGRKGGCGYYEKVLKIVGGEKSDLPKIARQLAILAKDKTIRTFYAGLVETGGSKVVFEEVFAA